MGAMKGCIVAIVASALIASGCRDAREPATDVKRPATTVAPKPVFRVGIATWPGFAPGFIAKAKGWFGDLPVEFVIIDDFTARQSAFSSGSTIATIGTIDSYSFETGAVDGRIVQILDESAGADGIVVKPHITTASQLRGARIAYTRSAPSHFLLIKYLERNGVLPSSIRRIEVDDPGRAGEAFTSGTVDAAVTWEPNITQITTSGQGRKLATSATFPEMIVDVLIASPAAYRDRPDDLRQFIRGWLRAVDYTKTQPDSAYAIMSSALQIPLQDFPQMAAGLRYADLERNRYWLIPADSSRAVRLFNDALDVWKSEGISVLSKAGAAVINPTYLPQ